jgi:hypothetical protein
MAFDYTLILRASAALNLAASATVSDAAIELAGGGISTGAEFVVQVATPDTDADLRATLEYSVDNGAHYHACAAIDIPFGFKGQKVTQIGTNIRPYRYAAASVQFRSTWLNLSGANACTATVAAFISNGEADIFGKKADDTLLV